MYFNGLPRAASTTQTCPHIFMLLHMPPCCRASKLTVKFSHQGALDHLSYPLYWTSNETSSVHSPSITRLLSEGTLTGITSELFTPTEMYHCK